MVAVGRYCRLLYALARYGLARELAFRGNFVAKLLVEVIWLTILLIFYRTIFSQTSVVADWTEAEYLFFVGCYFAMEGLIETLFLENCSEFSELVRTGDLDMFLLRPIDEQFLVSCRSFDWSTAPNILMGLGVMILALARLNWPITPQSTILFGVLFVSGTALAYSFLLMLTSTAVWFVRNQSLMEMWWLFTSLMRYPREIFRNVLGSSLNFFSFLVPVMLIINVPARTMVKVIEPEFVVGMLAATAVMLYVSRWFFRYSMRHYRSASS